MPAKRRARSDHQPALFAEELQLPESVGGVVQGESPEPVAEVAPGGRQGYATFAELDAIIERVYARYDELKRATGCKARRIRTLSG